MKRIVTFGLGGYCENCIPSHGHPLHNIIEDTEVSDLPHQPLNETGTLATLLVVTGNISIEDAANAVGVSPQDLINEAQAWAVALGINNGD